MPANCAQKREISRSPHIWPRAMASASFSNRTAGRSRNSGRIGMWEEPVETFQGSPIHFAQAIGLLDYPTLLAHVNYCDDAELTMLRAARRASSIARARIDTSIIRHTAGGRCLRPASTLPSEPTVAQLAKSQSRRRTAAASRNRARNSSTVALGNGDDPGGASGANAR